MIEKVEQPRAGVIMIRVSGVLRHADYKQLEMWIEEAAQQAPEGEKASLVCELVDWKGWTPRAVLDDAKLGLFTAQKSLKRIAIVGSGKWIDVGLKIMKPFARYEMKHFDQYEEAEAQEWAAMVKEPVG